MKYICQYCEKEFNSKLGKTVHENSCKKNPNRIQKIYPTLLKYLEYVSKKQKIPKVSKNIFMISKYISGHCFQSITIVKSIYSNIIRLSFKYSLNCW